MMPGLIPPIAIDLPNEEVEELEEEDEEELEELEGEQVDENPIMVLKSGIFSLAIYELAKLTNIIAYKILNYNQILFPSFSPYCTPTCSP
jgi:hypothetical protein